MASALVRQDLLAFRCTASVSRAEWPSEYMAGLQALVGGVVGGIAIELVYRLFIRRRQLA